MANRYFKGQLRALEGEVIKLYGKVVTGASGAISSQACKGFSVSKTGSEVGRYTVALEDKYNALLSSAVSVVGQDDSAYPIANGLSSLLRNVDVGAEAPSFDVQFVRMDTAADAELEDASEFHLEITLKNTTAY